MAAKNVLNEELPSGYDKYKVLGFLKVIGCMI